MLTKASRIELINTINKNCSIIEALSLYGVEVDEDRPLYCPFHENVNSKAAKHYSSSNSIYCFSESKKYGSYDVYSKLLKYNTDKLYSLVSGFDIVPQRERKLDVPFLDLKKEFQEGADIVLILETADKRWRSYASQSDS